MTDKEKVLTPITDRVKFNWMYAHPAMNANQDVVRAETARELESIAEELAEAVKPLFNELERDHKPTHWIALPHCPADWRHKTIDAARAK